MIFNYYIWSHQPQNLMRKYLLLSAALILLFGCNKNDGGPGNGNENTDPDHTPTPVAVNVNTELTGYVTNDQNQYLTGPNLFQLMKGSNSIGSFTVMGNGAFTTNTVTLDKYRTRTLVETGGSYDYMNTEQTYALTSSVKNYARIKAMTRVSVGQYHNDVGGNFALPNGGSINLGLNSFYQIAAGPYPGYFGPDIKSDLYITYLNPEDKDFALKLPSYLAGDDAQERWFLKSYGAITFETVKIGLIENYIDFYNGAQADLKLPIPASMQSGAPDSVNVWQLINGVWTKAGWAKKQGSFFTTKIGKVAPYTFAEPEKGVYLNINLRTDSSATITNTAIRIRSSNRVIAECRTDADGNAICFVPTHEDLVAEVVPDERVFSPNTYRYPIGAITKTTTVTVKLPNATPELTTVIANVLNCDGKPLANGMAKISFNALGTEYFIPVKNGRMSAAMWLYGTNNGVRIQVTDNATGIQSELVRMVLFYGDLQRINLYTCQNPALLYCNYTIDKTAYELRKDDATSSGVIMTASKTTQPGPLTIKATSGNLGLSFTTIDLGYATITSGLISDLSINGVSYNYDPSIEPMVSYTRYDPDINGYIEGCIILYYKDGLNAQHRLEANFKVKRAF
jgi:hypothetical protein